MSTGIQWTDETWNPIRAALAGPGHTERRGWHCERVSPGCEHCYAETLNEKRFGTGLGYTRPSRYMVSICLDEHTLAQPLHWRKPRRVFVCSMTDLFGEWVTDEMLDRVFAVMALTPHITYQVLTKRPEQALAYLTQPDVVGNVEGEADALAGALGWHHSGDWSWPLTNVWLGVSVEDQQRADERIPVLLETPAAVRFLSCEPLLGAVQLERVRWQRFVGGGYEGIDVLRGKRLQWDPGTGEDHRGMACIDWVIVGGESGPGARPCDIGWLRSIVAQCREAGTAVFYKQGGRSNRCPHDAHGGHYECFPPEFQVREFPDAHS